MKKIDATAQDNTPKKYLILHGDDVGVSHGANSASIRLLKDGHISSISVMAPCPWVFEAISMLKNCENCDAGVHVTLNSEWNGYRWQPVSSYSAVQSLVDDFGQLHKTTSETLLKAKSAEIAIELDAQILKLQKLGLKISHVDTHMGALTQKAEWLKAYVDAAKKIGALPMLVKWSDELESYFKNRNMPYLEVKKFLTEKEESGDVMLDRLITDVGGRDSYENRFSAYKKAIRSLKPGVSQIITHLSDPGEELSAMIENESREKRREWDTLILADPKFVKLLKDENIVLVNWSFFKHSSQNKTK